MTDKDNKNLYCKFEFMVMDIDSRDYSEFGITDLLKKHLAKFPFEIKLIRTGYGWEPINRDE